MALPQSQEEFEALSWHEIANLEDDIDSLIQLDVWKTAQVGDDQIQFQLVSGEQYELADGSGKNKMVFLSKNLLPSQKMADANESTTWKTSLVKQKLDDTYFGQLPEDLQNEIVEVKLPCFATPIESSTSSVAPNLEYVNSKLFIPSAPEIFPQSSLSSYYPKTDSSTTWEGKQYKWYETHTTASDRVKNRNSSSVLWWLRSPCHISTIWLFLNVGSGGLNGSYGVTNSNCLAAAFCLGKPKLKATTPQQVAQIVQAGLDSAIYGALEASY